MRKIRFALLPLLLSAVGIPQASAQYFGVGTNAALLATGTLNVSLEATLAPHWTTEVSLMWNPVKTRKLQAGVIAIQPGVRYWFFEEYAGHFLSAHLAAAQYDVGNVRFHRKGWLAGIGISYGYAWLLSTRWNLTLEAGAALYWMKDDKRDHYVPPLQDEYIRRSRRVTFGPSKCAVTFSYLF